MGTEIAIAVGQVWRDTYFTGPNGEPSARTVRIIHHRDGWVRYQGVTRYNGKSGGRGGMVDERVLRRNYRLET